MCLTKADLGYPETKEFSGLSGSWCSHFNLRAILACLPAPSSDAMSTFFQPGSNNPVLNHLWGTTLLFWTPEYLDWKKPLGAKCLIPVYHPGKPSPRSHPEISISSLVSRMSINPGGQSSQEGWKWTNWMGEIIVIFLIYFLCISIFLELRAG